jgi:2-deoxy-D-gluconate 3-dehydrogenase
MILDTFKLDGKVALVTGASRGLGQAMAIGLAEAGADIAGLDLTECSETCEQVKNLGRCYHSVVCDLREASPKQLSAVVDGVVAGCAVKAVSGQRPLVVKNVRFLVRNA